MSRPIDGTSLKNELYKAVRECQARDMDLVGQGLLNAIGILNKQPTIEPKRGEWIPCSERLPEEEGRYLCTVNAELHQVRDMLYKPTSWGDEHRCKWKLQEDCYAYDWFVLAWMPLPKPWKGADDE